MSLYEYDVAVVGAGHAGIEAALACARNGLKTALFTMSLDALANLPCNPSIGGTGKGHLVFEIDALGGEMGYVADMATIQSRTLNTGKGAAVRSKRVQADRTKYRSLMKETLESFENLYLIQGEITDIVVAKCKTCTCQKHYSFFVGKSQSKAKLLDCSFRHTFFACSNI